MQTPFLDQVCFRRALFRTVTLPLIQLLVLAGIFTWQVNQLLSESRWVDHTDQVISQAQRAQKLLARTANLLLLCVDLFK